MRRLVRGLLVVGGWLCCFQWLSPALADNNSPCSIQRSQIGQLFPNNLLATRLASEGAESFFEVKCSGKSSGMLRLSINSSRTRSHSGYVQIRLVSTSGIFNSSSSSFTSDMLNVPYGLLDGSGVGKVIYQIQISAPDRQLLQAARDYSVAINAELLP
jgi:hypothetical protein